MKIIIVGMGKTGESLVKNLTQEKYDIVGVDVSGVAVQSVIEKYDVNGIVGNGCLEPILAEAGAEDADLLIAVTDRDEMNILSCLVGKALGAKHLIAQVRDPEYYENFESLGEQFGINMFVNLEATLAERIVRVLKAPAEVKLSTFAGGRLEIAEFPVPDTARAVGKTLTEIRKTHKCDFLVIAIERGDEVIVPDGSTVVEAGDVVNVCSKHHELRDVLGYFGVEKTRVQSVMILGADQRTYYLAEELSEEGLNVKVIGKHRDKCENLKSKLPDINVVCDDYNDKEVLVREGIDDVDALVAMSSADEKNIVASLFARTHDVPKVITVIESSLYQDMLDDISLNLTYSPYEQTGAAVAAYIRSLNVPKGSEIVSMHRIAGGEAEALQFHVGKNPSFVGKSVAELGKKIKKGVLVCAVIRKRVPIVAHGDTVLEEDDDIVVASISKRLTQLEDIIR